MAKALPISIKDMMANAERKIGNVIDNRDIRVQGIEMQALSLQYLFDLEVLPFGLITLSGPPKTYKTSGLIDLAANALPVGQIYTYVTENKWSPSKVTSMIDDMPFKVIKCETNEQWQMGCTEVLMALRNFLDIRRELKAKDRLSKEEKAFLAEPIPPFNLLVDSLTGAQSENVGKKIEDAGHGDKTFQDRAMQNWMWFNTMLPKLGDAPVTIIVAQHLKNAIGQGKPGGPPVQVTSGGTGPSFMCTAEIRVKKIKEINTRGLEGAIVRWKCHFNSLGRDKREVDVMYVETYDEQNNQVAYFDWAAATVDILMVEKSSMDNRERFKAIFGEIIEYPKKGVGSVYSCSLLGISKQDALDQEITKSELGERLQAWDSPGRAAFKELLRIQPGSDYLAAHGLVERAAPSEIKDVKEKRSKLRKKNATALADAEFVEPAADED